MWKKYNKYRVLKVFFEDPRPEGGHQLRALSRRIDLSPKSVRNHLEELIKEGLVVMKKHGAAGYPAYYAETESEGFRLYKRLDTIASISETGLLDRLYDVFAPEAIVLYGSAARGMDGPESDIDLFVEAEEKDLDLSKYEKALGRRISLLFRGGFSDLPKELRNNIVNGAVLKGYLKAY